MGLVLHAAVAVAEPPRPEPRGFVGLGLHFSQTQNLWTSAAFVLEGGVDVPGLPLRGRAFVSLAGGMVQSDWSGDFSRYGLGVEARPCWKALCGIAGFDFGHERMTLVDNFDREMLRSGPILGVRFGIDVGPPRVRFRFAIERYWFKTHHEPAVWMSNPGVTFDVAYQF